MATPVRVADAGCAKCHAEIFTRYLTTPMANASGAATERPYAASPVKTRSGVRYTVVGGPGGAGEHLERTADSKAEARSTPLDYFLGSGHLGTTYTYSINGFLFESPIAWYAATKTFDMKPGLADLEHSFPALPLQSGCLRCHMSATQHSDAGTINHYKGLPFLHTGVTCEACHGETADHVSTGGRSKPVHLAGLDAMKRDSICINCHLEGDVLVERAGRSALDFVPGEAITDLVAYYVYDGKDATARAVSEVEQFAQSHCKIASGDKMSCTSCHDPHFSPAQTERAAFFRGKCLACHSDPHFAETHHPENKDCVSCHMKPTGAENIPHVAWTDHRILRLPVPARPQPADARNGELKAIYQDSASNRDRAMAYYKAMLAGDKTLGAVAWTKLNGVRNELANDPEALSALGVMTAARGESPAAAEIFRQVLALDSTNLTALSNLGTLLAKQGRLEEAQALLNTAFARNQDLSGLALNVARVDCMLGHSEAAKKVLQQALVYNPGLDSLESLGTQMEHCPVTDVH